MRCTWRSARSCIVISHRFNRSGIKSILTLCQGLGGLNLLRPTFTFSTREHCPFGYPCFAGEFSQTDAACVRSLHLLPGLVCDRSAHTATRSYRTSFFCTFKSFGSDRRNLRIFPKLRELVACLSSRTQYAAWELSGNWKTQSYKSILTQPRKAA